jgi:pimeloyl-ACP methyl ester carboxylesterase
VLTVCGLGSLVAGLVLYGAGVGGLVPAARSWWRVAVVLLALAVTYVVVLPVSVAIAATNVPGTTVGDATPADRGLEYSEVALETEDGVSLSAWYVPSTNGAAVAVLHGAGSTRSSTLDQAEVLARNGYGVLLLDARGHGRSGGRAMDFGWYGDEDAAAAVDFLVDRSDVDDDRVGLVGLSMGGEEAIGAAGADRRIAAVVAEGATNRAVDDKAWLSDVYGVRGALQERIEWLQYQTTDLLTDAHQPVGLRDAAAASRAPMLLIAAGEVPDEAHAAAWIRSAAADRVAVWVADGAGHTGALRAHPREWEERVVGFLDVAL